MAPGFTTWRVSADDAPLLLIDYRNDPLVPLDGAHLMVERLRNSGVEYGHRVVPGRGHAFFGRE